jgi:hypothetical protein
MTIKNNTRKAASADVNSVQFTGIIGSSIPLLRELAPETGASADETVLCVGSDESVCGEEV